jgi:hypothetical protein
VVVVVIAIVWALTTRRSSFEITFVNVCCCLQVKIYHPCINQVKVTLLGPGPQTGSPNFFPISNDLEVVLFSRLLTNGTGCAGGVHYFEFDDASSVLPEVCCTPRFNGTYRPQGKLSEFLGASMTADWTLTVQDLKEDTVVGDLLSWEIEFTSSPCAKTYRWENLTQPVGGSGSGSGAPVSRYGAHAIVHGASLFVYGGRDSADRELHDLHRYDIASAQWTALAPMHFDVALRPASSAGASFALTSWGLLRYGGYYRQPDMPQQYDNYDSSLAVQDPVTLRWHGLEYVQRHPNIRRDATFGTQAQPSHRYLGATVFIPSHSFHWRTTYSHHALYDRALTSSRTNFQGTISDSLLLIGGFDGSTGSVFDGSAGGFLKDIWMLRLSNWSTPGTNTIPILVAFLLLNMNKRVLKVGCRLVCLHYFICVCFLLFLLFFNSALLCSSLCDYHRHPG